MLLIPDNLLLFSMYATLSAFLNPVYLLKLKYYVFLFIYCFFTIYSKYLKRVISKRDGCEYLKFNAGFYCHVHWISTGVLETNVHKDGSRLDACVIPCIAASYSNPLSWVHEDDKLSPVQAWSWRKSFVPLLRDTETRPFCIATEARLEVFLSAPYHIRLPRRQQLWFLADTSQTLIK
jgi:hypothetical protein